MSKPLKNIKTLFQALPFYTTMLFPNIPIVKNYRIFTFILKSTISMKTLLFLSAILISGVTFGLNPSAKYVKKPDAVGLSFKTVKVPGEKDGVELNAWIITAKPGQKTTRLILISHNGEGNMADYLRKYKTFSDLGFTVVAFDYRGYGESSGFEIDNNMYLYPHFLEDVKAMIKYSSKLVEGGSIDMYGFGIGAGMAFGAGWNSPAVNKIIADTPFLSMEDLESRFKSWETPMEVPSSGYDKSCEPIHSVSSEMKGKNKQILIIIGSDDKLYAAEDMEKLQSAKKEVVRSVIVIDNPKNGLNFDADLATWTKRVAAFLMR